MESAVVDRLFIGSLATHAVEPFVLGVACLVELAGVLALGLLHRFVVLHFHAFVVPTHPGALISSRSQ